jgi:predicted anti-sigma-YlaC factor YlaD
MTCRTAYRYICDNLDERINSPRCRQIRQHLKDCPNCRAYLDSIKKTVSLYKPASSQHVPPSVHRRLIHLVNAEVLRTSSAHAKRHPRAGGR